MFKKTISDLKDLKEINHEVTVKIDEENTKQNCKTLIKAVAAIAVIHVIAHATESAIDSKSQKTKKSNN